jgi:hypothetical protein
MNNSFTTGNFGVYTETRDNTLIKVRIFEQTENSNKIALVTIQPEGQNVAPRVDVIEPEMWDYVVEQGMKEASADGVNITREPFHSYVAKAYWDIIK